MSFISRLFTNNPENSSILILRYINIWVLVGIPLLFSKNKIILGILPLIGLGGLSFLIIGIVVPKIRAFLVTYYYVSGVALLSFFLFLLLFTNNFYYLSIGAFLLGFTTANYEVKSMYSSISKDVEKDMIKGMRIYNMSKVMGIALGFFFAALLSGNKALYYSSLVFTGLILLLLLVLIIITIKKEYIMRLKKMKSFGVSTISWKKLPYAFLFTLDVTLFTFWYVYLPQQLLEQGFMGMETSIFLSLQAFSHAISQSLWEKIIIKFGALKSYSVSFLLHIFLVFFYREFEF